MLCPDPSSRCHAARDAPAARLAAANGTAARDIHILEATRSWAQGKEVIDAGGADGGMALLPLENDGFFTMATDAHAVLALPPCPGTKPLMFELNHKGDEAIVKYLINNQADPNKADRSGITPLHIAATQGYYEIAEHLLSKGANVDPLCQDGESPLFCAAIQGNESIVTLLLKHNADYNRVSKKMLTPLLASIHGSSLSCLEILIEAGADVNGTGCSVPPVALAAYKGLHRCIQCLLRNGANPNVPDEDNNIPIQIAAVKGWERCVEILLPHAPHLAQYEGMSISEIVQWERTERFRRSSRAIEQGDAAYWRKEHDIALRFYTEAAQVGHQDPALYAKRSLCHLHLHAPAKFIEEAINYMNMVLPNLSTSDPESDARKLVLDFARAWKEPGSASRLGSGSSPTDKTPSGEHQ